MFVKRTPVRLTSWQLHKRQEAIIQVLGTRLFRRSSRVPVTVQEAKSVCCCCTSADLHILGSLQMRKTACWAWTSPRNLHGVCMSDGLCGSVTAALWWNSEYLVLKQPHFILSFKLVCMPVWIDVHDLSHLAYFGLKSKSFLENY